MMYIYTSVIIIIVSVVANVYCYYFFQAERYAERNDMERARNHCNRYFCPLCMGASVWIAVAFVLYMIITVLGIIVCV